MTSYNFKHNFDYKGDHQLIEVCTCILPPSTNDDEIDDPPYWAKVIVSVIFALLIVALVIPLVALGLRSFWEYIVFPLWELILT